MITKNACLTVITLCLLSGIVLADTKPVGGKTAKQGVGKGSTEKPLRNMCLGDSITVGYTDNPIWKEPYKFGYRGKLYKLLKEAGYNFTFVGDSPQPWNKFSGDPSHGGTYKPEFDLRDIGQDKHQGGGGAPIPALKGWESKGNPDIILLTPSMSLWLSAGSRRLRRAGF